MAEERNAQSYGYSADHDDDQGGYEAPPSPKHHKKDTKKYVAFRSDDDESSEFDAEETPRKERRKVKKDRSNTFKEKIKSIKVKKREKDVNKEKIKEKEKEEKKEKKDKKRHKRSLSAGAPLTKASSVQSPPPANPVFAVNLELAVARSKIADGIELPTVFRQCIHYLEENGLDQEGIYRVSGIKSKIDELRYMYDHGIKVDLETDDIEPNIVAGLLKQYLRELPTNLLTQKLQPVFDALVGLKDEAEKVEQMKNLLGELPKPNYTLLSWLFVHLDHVMKNFSQTKMNIQNISIVFSPTMNISHGVLYIIMTNIESIFSNVNIIKYVEPPEPEIQAAPLKSPTTLAEELQKQEKFLDNLHEQMKLEGADEQEVMEKMWEVQRTVTQLKRKLKAMRKSQVQIERSATEDGVTRREEVGKERAEVHVTQKTEGADMAAAKSKPEKDKVIEAPQEPKKKKLLDIAKQPEEEREGSEMTENVRKQRRNEEYSRILEKCKEDKTSSRDSVEISKTIEKSDEKHAEAEQVLRVEIAASVEDEEDGVVESEDEEIAELLREERHLRIEQEELLALSARLKDRIQRELNDVEKLKLEIDEIKKKEDYVSPDSSSQDDSSDNDSDSESGSDSDSDNSDLENILKELQKENEKLENQTVDLVKALMEENEKCVRLNVELRIAEELKG